MSIALWAVAVVAAAPVGYVLYGITYVYQYEYGLRFRFGELRGTVEPGLRFRLPLVESIRTYSKRVVTVEVPAQSAMTADNVSLRVSAVVYFRVIDPERTVVTVSDHEYAISQLAQTSLRSTVGAAELDDVLGNREELADSVAATVEEIAGEWGIDVTAIEIREVEIPDGLQRVIAAQAEAEREKRARTRLAEAEHAAAEELVSAADRLSDSPDAMRLRQFQNLKEVAAESNSNVVVPVPSELFRAVQGFVGGDPGPGNRPTGSGGDEAGSGEAAGDGTAPDEDRSTSDPRGGGEATEEDESESGTDE